jgi:hypothetical protein
MAIDAELVAIKRTVQLPEGLSAPIPVLPPISVTRIVAAGSIDITADAEVLQFNNLSTSQTVFIRLNLDGDGTAAATGDSQSIRVEAGRMYEFGLRADLDATAYKLVVA